MLKKRQWARLSLEIMRELLVWMVGLQDRFFMAKEPYLNDIYCY